MSLFEESSSYFLLINFNQSHIHSTSDAVLFYSLVSIEILLLFISQFLIFLIIYAQFKVHILHANNGLISNSCLITYEIGTIGRLTIALYEMGFLCPDKDECSPAKTTLVICASYIRLYSIAYMMTNTIAVGAERIMAILYWNTYEADESRLFAFVTIGLQHCMVASLTTAVAFVLVDYFIPYCVCFAVTVIGSLLFLFVTHQYKQKLRNFSINIQVYTLSYKYQLMEMKMAIKMVNLVTLFASVAVCLVISLYLLPVILQWPSKYRALFREVSEIVISLAVCGGSVTAAITCRQLAVEMVRVARRLLPLPSSCSFQPIQVTTRHTQVQHFQSLQNQWNASAINK